jgi:hypothetical protein
MLDRAADASKAGDGTVSKRGKVLVWSNYHSGHSKMWPESGCHKLVRGFAKFGAYAIHRFSDWIRHTDC